MSIFCIRFVPFKMFFTYCNGLFYSNYNHYSGNIVTSVKDVIHVKASSLVYIFHILLPLHRAFDIRDSQI